MYTIDLLRRLGMDGKRICEVGPGGVGLSCARVLNAKVHTFDCAEWFRGVCESFSIPWGPVDLNRSARLPGGPYDAILLCEVIEHLSRWPGQILAELSDSLAPGGLLLISTQNLHRLSNRIRMLMGKRLFAHFVPEDLVMAHVREYTPEELEHLFRNAGFDRVCWDLVTIPERSIGLVRGAYRLATMLRPRLSNFIFCWAFKERETGEEEDR
jgi:2-polyprenyl-3-methyl-5-hydroxy-6-metoxy-1,4-benzoquinol methylase